MYDNDHFWKSICNVNPILIVYQPQWMAISANQAIANALMKKYESFYTSVYPLLMIN